MAKTDLKVTIDADAAKLEREVRRAQMSMQALEREIAKGNREADKFAADLNQRTATALQNVGRGMLAFGAATVAGLGLAAKAAIDWESAWAGVRKTVEGSPEQLAAVEQGLRDLATTLPATHGEIAAVAEAAGQLGVATDDIVGFTRVMIDLGETTNLTAEEAATSIAQMMNVMQTAPEDVGRLGAALVELGNNGASTERDIIQMAQRIAGAGAIVGLTEAEVLAFGNALASVGIEAEAGGSAISRVMINIASAVDEGGDAVAGFAEVAGMSSQRFIQSFETDPAGAIQAFVAGLGRIDAAGGNVFATLDDLGLSEIRVRDALLRLAGAGDLLQESLNDGARAWSENTALIEEAEKRYDTAEAKIQIARNALVDLAIDVGGVLLPAIAGLAEGAADLLGWFSDLPGPVKTVATVFAALVGTLSLLGGGLLLLAPRIQAARAEMQLLAATSPAAATGIRAAGMALRGLTVAGAVAGGLLLLDQIMGAIAGTSKEVEVGAAGAAKELLSLRDGISSDLINRVVEANKILEETPDIMGKISLGFTTSSSTVRKASNDLEKGISAIDQALSSMVAAGDSDAAGESFRALAAEWEAGGGDIDELKEKLPQYRDALAAVDVDQQLVADSSGALGDALSYEAEQAEAAQAALQEYLDELRAATDPVFAVINSLENVRSAQVAYNEAVKEHGKNSAEARGAAVTLAEAIADMEQAVSDGELSWENFDATLSRWVSQGVLTEQQADAIRDSANGARKAAEDYEGDYAAELKLARDRAAERAAKAELDRIARERQARISARAWGVGRTEDIINSVARDRYSTVYVNVKTYGNLEFHRGGVVPRLHGGGMPRFHAGHGMGLGADEVPAILQTGERVLSRSQNAIFTQLAGVLARLSVTPRGASRAATVELRISGDGPLYEQIAYGVRTGQLRLSANGAPVKVG